MNRRRRLTAILAMGLALFGAVSFGAQAEPSVQQERDGITYWEPRYGEILRSAEAWVADPAHGLIASDIAELTPPNCRQLIWLLHRPYAFGLAAEYDNHQIFNACMVFVLLQEAGPTERFAFDRTALISDIERRLDLRSFWSWYTMGLPDDDKPFSIGEAIRTGDYTAELSVQRTADSLTLRTSRDGREVQVTKIQMVALADLTGDGKGDVLALWRDKSSTGRVLYPIILTSDTMDGLIRGTFLRDWFADNRQHFIKKYGVRD